MLKMDRGWLSVIVNMPDMRGAMMLSAEQGDPWPVHRVLGEKNVKMLNSLAPNWLEELCSVYDDLWGTTNIR